MPADDVCRCCGRAGGVVSLGEIASTDTPHRFGLVRCRDCGVARTTPQPVDLAPYYATDLAATMTRPTSRVFATLRRRRLARELRRITRHGDPGTIVDVGCGAGDFVAVAHARGCRAIGADAAATPPSALVHAALPYLRFDFDRYACAEPLALERGTVVLRHVLEHVRDPYACLERLRRDGARQFYLVVPNARSRECRLLGSHWYLWDPPRHLWHFDPTSLARLCARLGLTIVDRGTDTAPTLVPSLYRRLRLRGWSPRVYERFGPTSTFAACTAPLNLLLAGNVTWMLARATSN
jgi:hypothetical protein